MWIKASEYQKMKEELDYYHKHESGWETAENIICQSCGEQGCGGFSYDCVMEFIKRNDIVRKSIRKDEIFPLKVSEFVHDYGMGVRDFRYSIRLANGELVCYSDDKPKYIDKINQYV
jgi:hypothetical protein